MPDYDADFYGWANEQAALLRSGRLADADIANIAEEIESMGRSEKRELVSRLTIRLQHLLKWQSQTARRGKSWRSTIRELRVQIRVHLKDNPSLGPALPSAVADAFELGLIAAEGETAEDEEVAFPDANPWTKQQILDDSFFPE